MLETPLVNIYSGIGRLYYFLGFLAVGFVSSFSKTGMRGSQGSGVASLFVIVIALVLVVQRLKNIGMSPWWALLIFVPIGNIWLGFRCITAQEGYIETRRLDSTGRVIAGLVIGFWVLVLVLVVVAVFVSP